MTEEFSIREKRFNRWITIVSIAIPLVVVLLFAYKIPNAEPLSFLPPIYASINGLTAVLLIMAVVAIKKGKRELVVDAKHRLNSRHHSRDTSRNFLAVVFEEPSSGKRPGTDFYQR